MGNRTCQRVCQRRRTGPQIWYLPPDREGGPGAQPEPGRALPDGAQPVRGPELGGVPRGLADGRPGGLQRHGGRPGQGPPRGQGAAARPAPGRGLARQGRGLAREGPGQLRLLLDLQHHRRAGGALLPGRGRNAGPQRAAAGGLRGRVRQPRVQWRPAQPRVRVHQAPGRPGLGGGLSVRRQDRVQLRVRPQRRGGHGLWVGEHHLPGRGRAALRRGVGRPRLRCLPGSLGLQELRLGGVRQRRLQGRARGREPRRPRRGVWNG
mmetsp:Transcript_21816/g.37525  ORF Transcript_21816/g.37525 Transcript_21816/m.37525 type:complete len:264 (+) Transcript_21816:257-1048(+)